MDIKVGAAIYQKIPDSAIFRLPALSNPDVRNWMSGTFPSEYALICASAGEPIDLKRIQDNCMRTALEEQRVLIAQLTSEVRQLRTDFQRRTHMLSPAKGFTNDQYARSLDASTSQARTTSTSTGVGLGLPFMSEQPARITQSVSNAPSTQSPILTSQIDLLLPPLEAFAAPGESI